jgi:hypothetical protein
MALSVELSTIEIFFKESFSYFVQAVKRRDVINWESWWKHFQMFFLHLTRKQNSKGPLGPNYHTHKGKGDV